MADIDPEILAARQAMADVTGPFDVMALPPARGRALIEEAALSLGDGLPEMERTLDYHAGGVRVRAYFPEAQRGTGLIFFIHGGGWFAGSVETHDRMARYLADRSGRAVISTEYRLAPEYPFPAALDDVEAAWAETLSRAAGWQAETDRSIFVGDSAGAHLALALALRLRTRSASLPRGLALLYGTFAPRLDTASYREFGKGGYGLTAERMKWYWANFLGDAEPSAADLLKADLIGLPPVVLGIAGADPVADDSRLLHIQLRSAAVDCKLIEWAGATHGFLQMTRDVALARRALDEVANEINRLLD